MNTCSNNEVNSYEVSPNPPTEDENIINDSDDEKNDYIVTPDTPPNSGKIEKNENDKEEIVKIQLRRKHRMKT